jgi:hypothetical protein
LRQKYFDFLIILSESGIFYDNFNMLADVTFGIGNSDWYYHLEKPIFIVLRKTLVNNPSQAGFFSNRCITGL